MVSDGNTPWARFTPGPAVGIIGPRTACLVLDQPDSELVRGLSSAIERDAPVDELLDGMVRTTGLALPPFGIVRVEGRQVRVLVRGDVSVVVDPDGDGGGTEVTVGGRRTWCEEVVDDVDTARIHLGSASESPTRFETSLGVIPAERLDLVIADAPAVDVSATKSDDAPGRPGPDPDGAEAAVPDAVFRDGARPDDAEPEGTGIADRSDQGDAVSDDDGGEAGTGQVEGPADDVDGDDASQDVVDRDVETPDDREVGEGAEPSADGGQHGGSDEDDDVVGPPRFTSSRPGAVPTTFQAEPDQVDGSDGPPADGAERSGVAPLPPVVDRDTLIGPFEPEPGDSADQATIAPRPDGAPAGPSSMTEAPADGPLSGSVPSADADVDDYDHLFGATQFRTVEEAAVRPVEDHDDGRPGTDGPSATTGSPLIGSVPTGLDMPPPTGAPVLLDADDGDHDGHTISLSALRATGSGPVAVNAASMPGTSPPVHAVRCPSGHLNPPHAGSCRSCGATIEDQEHVTVPRPVLGRLEFADGRVVEVSRPLLIGRAPRAEGALGGEPPELVAVPSPSKEVSGTHVEIRLEGWQVLVVDRHSTNGTVIVLPGRDPMRLRPDEPFPITPGTSVSLADEVELTFEASP